MFPLSFPAANSLLLHLPLVGAPTTIPANPRRDLEEEAAAAVTDPPDPVVVDVTHTVPILIDLGRCHDRDPVLAPPWPRLEETGDTGLGHALGLPVHALLVRGADVAEEEEVEEAEETTWTTEDVGVLAALVTTAMIAGVGAAAAAVTGTDVRCIPHAGFARGSLGEILAVHRTR